MTNVKMTLRLNKVLDLKTYLNSKAETNKKYEEYVDNSIKKAEESMKAGRVRPINCILKEIEEEFGLMQR